MICIKKINIYIYIYRERDDYKAFKKSEEEDNIPAGNQELDSTRKDIESQLHSIININKKLDELEKSQNTKQFTKDQLLKLEAGISKLERIVIAYSKTFDDHTTPPVRQPTSSTNSQADMSTNKRVNNHREKEHEILMCMDSNSRHIKFRKLWTVRNSETRRIYRLDQLH